MHDRFYSHVFTTCQLLLSSTKLYDRSYSRVFSTHQQSLMNGVVHVSHKPSTQVIFKISQGMKGYMHFFVYLDMSCTVAGVNHMCKCHYSSTE